MWEWVPGWKLIRSLVSSSVIRTSMIWLAIVPVAVAVLRHTDDPIVIDTGGCHPLIISLTLPFSWRCLWVAGLCGAVSQLLFVSCCPSMIQEFRSFSEYWNSGYGPHYLTEQAIKAAKVERRLYDSLRCFSEEYVLFGVITYVAATLVVPIRRNGDLDWTSHVFQGANKLPTAGIFYAFDEVPVEIRERLTVATLEDEGTSLSYYTTKDAGIDERNQRHGYSQLQRYLGEANCPARLTTTLLLFVSFSLYGYVIFQSVKSVLVYLWQ